jgi:dephospho-CoA kinase
MKRIAITGNAGSGKSTVASFFKKWGAEVIDADEVAHRVLSYKKREIVEAFGEDILKNGEIDRKKLGERVFTVEGEMDKLFSIVKEEIVRVIDAEIERIKSEICVVDAPLLFEYGLEKKFDKIVVVTAPFEDRLKRFISKTGYSEDLAKKIFEKQIDEGEKIKRAHYVIVNRGSLEELEAESLRVFEKIKEDP